MSRDIFRAVNLAVALTLSLAGYAFTYSIKPELLPAPEASAMVQQWPLSVGLYIGPQVRLREFSRGAAHVVIRDFVKKTAQHAGIGKPSFRIIHEKPRRYWRWVVYDQGLFSPNTVHFETI